MFPETLVLYGNESIDQILRKLLILYSFTVRTLLYKGCGNIALRVINLGGIGCGSHMNGLKIRCRIQNASEHTKAEGCGDDTAEYCSDKKTHLKEVSDTVSYLTFGIIQRVQCFIYIVSGVICHLFPA